jgi:uncharacterized protein Veg
MTLPFVYGRKKILANAGRLARQFGQQWVVERKQHCDTNANDEGCVDQAQQQEHLTLQRGDEFWLACR